MDFSQAMRVLSALARHRVEYVLVGSMAMAAQGLIRLLGYDAKTLLFGANLLFYDRMIEYPKLMSFAFSSSRIKNYPYVTGE